MADESQAEAAQEQPDTNILKSRDDAKPVRFAKQTEADESGRPQFKLQEHEQCSWTKADEPFGIEALRQRIEPWLTALCQSEHISLLLGSGLSSAVHKLATGQLPDGMAKADFGDHDAVISAEAARLSSATGRAEGNIEDQIRAAVETLRGYEILALSDAEWKPKAEALCTQLGTVLLEFADSVRAGEEGVLKADGDARELAFNYLVSFLMTFASRTGTRDRLHIFTTNYDRFIEAGAEAAGVHLLDRFVGQLAPVFRSSRLNLDMHYNPPGIRGEPRYLEGVARFTKLHGSLDWLDCGDAIRRISLPFGAENMKPYMRSPASGDATATQLMVYPNAAKDRETASYPYVELFRDFAAAACRPNHTLVAFGYGFGDDHLNRVIADMLTIPSTHLVIISFNDPIGRIMNTFNRIGHHAQISLLVGPDVGEFVSLVDNFLPKPAIDRTTYRMAELLKNRWGTRPDSGSTGTSQEPENGGSQ